MKLSCIQQFFLTFFCQSQFFTGATPKNQYYTLTSTTELLAWFVSDWLSEEFTICYFSFPNS